MKSVGYYAKGEPETLVEIELSTPQPGPRDLLVSVRAVSVNPVDVKRRRSGRTRGESLQAGR
jgi:NADPH:quinone reductase-like Zn-dependent oxidoreductase